MVLCIIRINIILSINTNNTNTVKLDILLLNSYMSSPAIWAAINFRIGRVGTGVRGTMVVSSLIGLGLVRSGSRG